MDAVIIKQEGLIVGRRAFSNDRLQDNISNTVIQQVNGTIFFIEKDVIRQVILDNDNGYLLLEFKTEQVKIQQFISMNLLRQWKVVLENLFNEFFDLLKFLLCEFSRFRLGFRVITLLWLGVR